MSDSETESLQFATGPGARLRRAREQAQLTIAEVASSLQLSVQVIDDLEHNRFQGHLAPVFVRGYLRGYAQLLSLSVEDVFADLKTLELPDTTQNKSATTAWTYHAQNNVSRMWSLRQLFLLGCFAIFASLSLWWIVSNVSTTPVTAKTQTPTVVHNDFALQLPTPAAASGGGQ